MKRSSISLAMFTIVLIALAALTLPSMAQVPGVASIAGKVHTNNGVILPEMRVTLVNSSNISQDYPEFNQTVGEGGFFQFNNVTPGNYTVFGWCPYYSWGFSAPIVITGNGTYTASVDMLPEPVYADISAKPQSVPYNDKADINVTIYDHWGNVVPNWYIVLESSAGSPSPSSGLTDKNGNFKSSLQYQENVGSAVVTAWAKAANGSYYQLQGGELPTATPTPSATAKPSATVAPNATILVTPSPTASVPINATPSAPLTPTASAIPTKATPGFELIVGLFAMGLAILISKIK